MMEDADVKLVAAAGKQTRSNLAYQLYVLV